MYAELANVGLAFFEGFALIISPCILPILPIILSGSLTGRQSRPFGIILGFVLSFTLFTLFSRVIIQYLHLSDDAIRTTSYLLLLLFGIVMISSYLTEKFTLITQRLTQIGSSLKTANNPESGFAGGIIFGCLVGIIWTPCAGPILAAVIVQVVIQKTTLSSLFVVLAFGLGAGVPMLLIAILGRKLMDQFAFFRNKAALFRKLLGLIIIFVVLSLIYDAGLSFTPKTPVNGSVQKTEALINGLEHPYPAPEIAGISAWINSPPLILQGLQGKVVLIDFWTYSCINCIRTLPYLKKWYAKYHHLGFEIIGVHSPEFEFEHDLNNVKNAVVKDGILYPVALDNQFETWQNFHNEYWPAHYLIDKSGRVVYEHFGEGEYDVTENNIRFLLGLNNLPMNSTEENYSSSQTPETYLGYEREERFSSNESVNKYAAVTYTYPVDLPTDHWALKGKWRILPDKIIAMQAGAAIKLHFNAGKIYAVMGAYNAKTTVKVLLDNKLISTINVGRQQLYTLTQLNRSSEGTIELISSSPGLQIYTFTFGS